LFAWETLLPTIGFFPVTWQVRAMFHSFKDFRNWKKREYIQKKSNIQRLAKNNCFSVLFIYLTFTQ
jgi:hypothetical protein